MEPWTMETRINWFSYTWKPPKDLRKPKFPYVAGQSLAIRRHTPPPPFGLPYYKNDLYRPMANRLDKKDATQTDWCLQYPPRETHESGPSQHLRSSVHALQITAKIACKEGRGAQVVRCILDGKPDNVYVAKIYDALYYPSYEHPGRPSDITYQADGDYSREAAVYEHFGRSGLDGCYSPKYHGSWTFDVPLVSAEPAGSVGEQPTSRPVRMILMEWIPGASMLSYLETNKIDSISPTRRLDILAEALESNCYLRYHRIEHGDFKPRNILLADSAAHSKSRPPLAPRTDNRNSQPASNSLPRLYIIDFNRSYILDSPCMEREYGKWDLPPNPMHMYWGVDLQCFDRWVPDIYREREKAFRGWLKSKWGNVKGYAAPCTIHRKKNNLDDVEYISPESDLVR
ncbi:Protein kinase-like domain protein [Niveomyces insectorum RCEF 264]|uniref:Protein kinase-like domain protein n=1 Tax=Niveomyces insectorum RCEF 264 TaxID=1081102 RepID=A0A162MMW6_9HYPO|nr:Protein kinase-like domain protein [Niveomyces insectorum RCEF 264]